MNFYSLMRSFEDGHVSLVPPHCSEQFKPLVTVPLQLDLTWSIGFVYRTSSRNRVAEYLAAAKEVFRPS